MMRQAGYYKLEIDVIAKELDNAMDNYFHHDSNMDPRAGESLNVATQLISELGNFSGSGQALKALQNFQKNMKSEVGAPNEINESVEKSISKVQDNTIRPLNLLAPNNSSAHYQILKNKLEALKPAPVKTVAGQIPKLKQ